MANDLNTAGNSIEKEKQKRRKEKLRLLMLSVGTILVLLALWEAVVRLGMVNAKYLCAPTTVLKTFFVKLTDAKPDGAALGVHLWTSLKLVFCGYSLAVAVGVPLGLFLSYYYTLDKLITPIFEIMRPIPPIAWIPLSLIWLGIGTTAKAFIIFVAAFVPCVINSYTGIRLTNPVLVSVAKTCGASRWEIFTTVCIPSAMPMAFTGIRVALGNAWSTLVAAELIAATSGLGYMIQQGRSFGRSDIIIVGMFTIGITGAALHWLVGRLENKVIQWRAER